MFNFKGRLTKFQIERFEAIQGFIGGCVNNIGDLAMSITTLVGLQNNLASCSESVKRADNDPESNLMMFRQLYGPIDAARVLCDKVFDTGVPQLLNKGIHGMLMASVPNKDHSTFHL